jgi:hypothetical protein
MGQPSWLTERCQAGVSDDPVGARAWSLARPQTRLSPDAWVHRAMPFFFNYQFRSDLAITWARRPERATSQWAGPLVTRGATPGGRRCLARGRPRTNVLRGLAITFQTRTACGGRSPLFFFLDRSNLKNTQRSDLELQPALDWSTRMNTRNSKTLRSTRSRKSTKKDQLADPIINNQQKTDQIGKQYDQQSHSPENNQI